ncbi:ABC transporter permease [Marinoscillum sp. MHG1-6]|uniref:cell division protein FtsX n=1 Tax=Marinoscillum sp. MHG1-6 TaxID=2959627 RepID=UPI0021573E5E|nr:permease-like cell division protein FtsX [Marinoscillum sp. MHG1-6]
MESKARKKRKLGSYPLVSVVFSISLSLLVIGMFGMILLHANKLTRVIQENIEVQVYLNKNITDSEVTKISRSLGAMPYVLQKEDNAEVRLVTKEEAAEQFIEDTGEDFTQFLGDNPLRDLLVLNIEPAYQPTDSLRWIQSEIAAINGVYEVSYVESLVESINSNLTKIGAFLLGFSIILLLVVVILINNTIKLALFSQRFLIRSMQLVGATGRFIRTPFLVRAIWYGAISGLLASGVLYSLLMYANEKIEDLSSLQDERMMLLLFGSLVILGILVGFLSTFRAVRKYLKMSLDELY